ncbi:MAG: hypothetical protein ACLRTA_07615, partial [Clostridia bacterium]
CPVLWVQFRSIIFDILSLKVREVHIMFTKKIRIYITSDERNILAKSLIELRNSLIREGKYTDPVDDLLLKVLQQ